MDATVASLCVTTLPLLLGWAMDRLWGDPPRLPHLIVGYGSLIARGERALNNNRHGLLKGALLTVVLVGGIYASSHFLFDLLEKEIPTAYILISALCIFFCLSGQTLICEVRAVFHAVNRSPEEGRKQVARIVGRDTSDLSAQEIRAAALETLAENLSDGVVAPLFWYALLGTEGMMAYKMVNTLDSMIGYQTDRYLYFGRFAARLDDVANYIPARLTAGIMILVGGRPSLFNFVRREGKQHISPNSGYPEAALAGLLNARFGGTHNYFGKPVYKPFIGVHERAFNHQDLERSVRINRLTEYVVVGLILLLLLSVG